jgi:hypothetical protein
MNHSNCGKLSSINFWVLWVVWLHLIPLQIDCASDNGNWHLGIDLFQQLFMLPTSQSVNVYLFPYPAIILHQSFPKPTVSTSTGIPESSCYLSWHSPTLKALLNLELSQSFTLIILSWTCVSPDVPQSSIFQAPAVLDPRCVTRDWTGIRSSRLFEAQSPNIQLAALLCFSFIRKF